MRSPYVFLAVFIGLLAFAWLDSSSKAGINTDVTGRFGDPIPGLNSSETATFEFGRAIFMRRFTRAEGLGPHFNASSCQSCHEDPAPGGSSQRYRDFLLVGAEQPDGSIRKVFPDCTEDNVSTHDTEPCLPSVVLPHFGPKGTIANPVSPEVEHVRIPASADVIARRNSPPIFGIGLFRFVPDHEILSRADPNDADGDGISGRVNRVATEDDAIGRFGYKCQTASIEAFNRGALINQMGITSDSSQLASNVDLPGSHGGFLEDLFSTRTAHAQVATPVDRITDFDGSTDPEITRGELLALVFFQENLAAPRRGHITPSARLGEQLFEQIGCADCHVPSLETTRRTSVGSPLHIHPYTDLLIHDMGPDLADGIVMHEASGTEFRTQPLWGLCKHFPFLHDGRADTVEEAILLHGGEAQASRDNYADLSTEEKLQLRRFLESL